MGCYAAITWAAQQLPRGHEKIILARASQRRQSDSCARAAPAIREIAQFLSTAARTKATATALSSRFASSNRYSAPRAGTRHDLRKSQTNPVAWSEMAHCA